MSMNPNCDSCGCEDAQHVLCEVCMAADEADMSRPFRDTIIELADVIHAYIKAKDQDRVAEFTAMKRAEKKARKLVPRTSQPSGEERGEAIVAWYPPPSYAEIESETPRHRRCRYCTGAWWGLSHCCRRGLATEDYGARLIASLEGKSR